jgi:hypothetical protein
MPARRDSPVARDNSPKKNQVVQGMKNRSLGLMALLATTLLFSACPSETTIGQLNGEPGRYRNKEVSVRGTVNNSFGALGMGAYELEDETGRIWVLTENGVPTKGSQVRAVGQYINGVTWAGRNFGSAIREKNRSR